MPDAHQAQAGQEAGMGQGWTDRCSHLTLGVPLRFGRDNCATFTPKGGGATKAENQPGKRRGRLTKSIYILEIVTSR